MTRARLSADRRLARAGGKSGQRREGQLLTATGSNPRESATETKPPTGQPEGKGETSGVRAHNRVR